MNTRTTGVRRWLVPGALSAVLAGGVFWFGQSQHSLPPATAQNDASPTASRAITGAVKSGVPGKGTGQPEPATPATGHQPVFETPRSLGPDPFAPSLAGTDIDGSLRAGPDGGLIIDLRVRDFFDYFLSTVGEVSPETAIDQIRQLALGHLPEPAARQALDLLDQYLAYKQAALSVMQTELDPALARNPGYQLDALGEALANLKQLRQATFSAEAHQAFFGQEEAYSEYTLASLAIAQRDDLSLEGKQALVEWHRNQLPASMRSTEQRLHSRNQQQQARVAAIDAASSPEAAGEQLARLGLAGEEVESVVRYLKERDHFERRFQDFTRAVNREPTSGLSSADQDRHRDTLLEQHFPDARERTWARLKLLDQG